ncbi:MAG: hypothetical protein ABEJ69_03275 [Candidatus Nanohaloarchaea archaeon]
MVKFETDSFNKEDHFFVDEDPARIYRGLKDMLVEEFDIDRIEEGKNEFSVRSPKDRIRMHAFKEKSPHTVLYFNLSWKAKDPKDIFKQDRGDVLKAAVNTTGKVVTVYPGQNPLVFEPTPITDRPQDRVDHTHLLSPEKSAFQRSKLYKILVGIWYNKFYSKEVHRYEEEMKETVVRINNLMREKFGVEKSIERTGASHYTPPWQ